MSSPKLRFKGFSGDWNINKLGIISDARDGTHDSPKYHEEGFPFITSKNLSKDGKIDFSNVNYICLQDYSKFNKRSKVEINDILFGMIGTIGNPVIVRSTGFAIKNVALIKEKQDLKNNYLIHYLSGSNIQNQFKMQNTGGTQKFLSLYIIRNLEINYPSFKEQEKIANFFNTIDQKLNLLKEKKEKLELYKKGLMQQIFSQELRFKDEQGNEFPEWEEKKLEEVSEVIMGQSPESKFYNDDEIGLPLIQGNADIKNRFTEPRIFTSHITKKCEIGDIILTVRAPVGAVAMSLHIGCIGRGVCLLRNLENSNQKYLYQYLLFFENQWSKLEQGSTFTAVSGTEIKNLLTPSPYLPEQEKIAQFLSTYDAKINLVETQIQKTELWKKGLLQQMFV